MGLTGLKTRCLAPQLLRLPPEGQARKTPSSERQWGWCPQDPQDYSKQTVPYLCLSVPRSYPCTGLSAEGAQKNAHLLGFPWKRFDCLLYKLLPEGLASNLAHNEGLAAILPRVQSLEFRKAGGHFPCLLPPVAPTITLSHQYLPRRSLSTPQVLGLPPKGQSPRSLSSESQEGLHPRGPQDNSKQRSSF